MENLLNDKSKVEENNLRNDGILSFPLNHEKWVDNILKKLLAFKSISLEIRSLKPVGTKPG